MAKTYRCAGNGKAGDWGVSLDEELGMMVEDPSFQLVIDHPNMTLSNDGSQVQIELGINDIAKTIDDLIHALKQAKRDLE